MNAPITGPSALAREMERARLSGRLRFDGECLMEGKTPVAMLLLDGPDPCTSERELGNCLAAAPEMLRALKEVKALYLKYPVARFIPEIAASVERMDALISRAEMGA